MTHETPAGWYPAAHAEGQLRYWDGQRWLDIAPPTEHYPIVKPVVASPRRTTNLPVQSAHPVDRDALMASKKRPRRWPLLVIPIAIALLVAGVATHYSLTEFQSGATNYTPKPKPPRNANSNPEVPAGYTDSGVGIAMKFVDRECSLSIGRCSHMEVIALKDCPTSVYVELNLLDAGGRVIGFTNDSVGSLRKGQTAIFEFNVLEEDTERVEVVDASCF